MPQHVKKNASPQLPDPQITNIGGGRFVEDKIREFAREHGLQVGDIQSFLNEIEEARKSRSEDPADTGANRTLRGEARRWRVLDKCWL